ncbi:hypothetical protein [Chloracidobacterium aggregatum]|uniref:Uncharacterized protein n=2 Tax=Chloracidobacterium TaxID=458032 RepID=A0ABX8B3E2_9BACT|nr:hypothetical protein [Chloracidobacterium aggregatum]QUV86618.1 hypothetical protein J8C03_13435 [Chloracidobacterium sp. 2]QUV95517.1 hypothetical protein J8C05_11805 [Chloracidobacterium sp. N]QUV98739.1 hypothetical protein J8C00_13030 [Chloracidobacterium sp. E]
MPEVGGVNQRQPLPSTNSAGGSHERVGGTRFNPVQGTIGQPGEIGQPRGLPAPEVPGQKNILPDALLGRDPSQALAAEQLRATGGASATEELLGLNQQPTMPGTILPPLGNDVALRHLTPTMRRELLRKLLDRQQRNARRLLAVLPRDEEEHDPERRRRRALPEDIPAPEALALPEPQRQRASHELHQSLRLLELIDRLMAMQDETLAQMSTSTQR